MGAERPIAKAVANIAEPAARIEMNPTGCNLSAPPLDVVLVVVEWVVLEGGGVVGELAPVPVRVRVVDVTLSERVDVVLSETVDVRELVVVMLPPVALAL